MTLRKVDSGWHVDAQPGGRGGRRFRKTLKTQAEAKAYEAWLTTQVVQDAKWLPVKRDTRRLSELVDLWHANDSGEYDNKGFRLRGHLFTDSEGRYAFHTILPGLYPGRTRHYHIKVQAPGIALLTTQFYFPNEERNQTDGLFRSELVMRVADREDSLSAQFDVVLAVG